MTILDDIAAQKAAITSTADGYISAAKQTAAAQLTEMQALDAALADLETAGAAERAKLAPAIAALGALNLGPTPAAPPA
jgi:hypothetical protein